jgi:hypothetical protein
MQRQKGSSYNKKKVVQGPPKRKLAQTQGKSRAKPVQVGSAAAYATAQVGKAPAITQRKDSCRIHHRELLTNIIGQEDFTVSNTFPLNPGLPSVFPWLSTQALGWEEYKFHKLDFKFYTRTGSSTPGSVLLIPDYDASDVRPYNEQIASSYADTAEDAPWKDIVCKLNPRRMNGVTSRKYVRSDSLSSGTDIKLYDVGTLFVGVVDAQAPSVPWGKLWVEYDIEFFIPSSQPSGGLLQGGSYAGAVSMSAGNPMGSAPTIDSSALGIQITNPSTFYFSQPGSYLMVVENTGTTMSPTYTLTSGAGISNVVQSVSADGPGTKQTNTIRLIVNDTRFSTLQVALSSAGTITSTKVYIARAPTGSLQ